MIRLLIVSIIIIGLYGSMNFMENYESPETRERIEAASWGQ
jgi:hypothetical protein